MSFIRQIEDFTCVHCGAAVVGNGYTNHCPHCLWSKHVDIDPGDRKAECGGVMRPAEVARKGDGWSVVHVCEKCGHRKQNILNKDDNFDEAVKITSPKSGAQNT